MRPILAFVPLLLIACNSSPAPTDETPLPWWQPRGDFYGFAVNRLILPADPKQFAIDLNGDGKVDDRFGAIVATLAQQGIFVQDVADRAVAEGRTVLLWQLQTTDERLRSDIRPGLVYANGASFEGMWEEDPDGPSGDGGCAGCPDFGGMGTFVADGDSSARFVGALQDGRYRSVDPVKMKGTVGLVLALPFLPDRPPIRLSLWGAQVAFQVRVDPDTGAATLVEGRLRGSIRDYDAVARLMVPLAEYIAAQASNCKGHCPAPSPFDTGDCTRSDGSRAQPHDGRVDPCEVLASPIIRSLFAADVQIYDDAGNYAPQAKNTRPDSLSFAIAFTAVGAKIVGL